MKASPIYILLYLISLSEFLSAKAPNIILFFSDDAGYSDFGFQKDHDPHFKDVTPHLNQMAEEGAVFEQAYVTAPVCSPSRAGLLTGRYQERFGHEMNLTNQHQNQGFGMPVEEKTMADYLKAAGYKTACFGKWHLGRQDKYHPNSRGFDHFYGCIAGARSYFPIQKSKSKDDLLQENGNYLKEDNIDYFTDHLRDAALDYIDQNKENPFFMYLSFTAPHGPLHAKESYVKKFDYIPNEEVRGINRRVYAAMLASMDESIGSIIKKIKSLGLDENTLFVFANDNGGPFDMGTQNHPLKGYKSHLYEGGIRVPMVFRWKGKIPSGQRIATPTITLDFLPTFLAASQEKIPLSNPLDGLNLLPLLQSGTPLKQRSLFWRRYGPGKPIAIRNNTWKMIIPRQVINGKYLSYSSFGPELYHLKEDPRESTNLYGYFPEVEKDMIHQIQQWEETLVDPLWGTDEGLGHKNVSMSKKGRRMADKPKLIQKIK